MERVVASPVVPRMQSPSVPLSRWNWRRVRRANISTAPLAVKGVMRATKLPLPRGVKSSVLEEERGWVLMVAFLEMKLCC